LHYLRISPLAVLTSAAAADTWTVDDDAADLPDADFTSIQDAIAESADGDEILVYPGTYAESILLINRVRTIRSVGGPSVTTVEGGTSSMGVFIVHDGGGHCVIEGISIRGYHKGVWVLCNEGGHDESIINDCIIEANELGVLCEYSRTVFQDCVIADNLPLGGIECDRSASPRLIGCTIRDNEGPNGDQPGGGLFSYVDFWSLDDDGDTRPVVESTVFCGNVPHQVYGPWTDAGDVCIALACEDSDGDGVLNECGKVGDGVHEVPGEFASIEAAIAAAGDGDVVLVGPGVWTDTGNAVVDPRGKQITIRASAGPENTILDGEHLRRVLLCDSGEQPETVIEGFTLRHGLADDSLSLGGNKGGGVLCLGGHPSLTNCHIVDNVAIGGGGLAIAQGGADLANCIVSGNQAEYSGALLSTDSDISLSSCSIEGNAAAGNGGLGGGVYVYGREQAADGTLWSHLEMTNTTISHNTSGQAEGLLDAAGLLALRATIVAENCHFTENTAFGDDEVWPVNVDSTVALWGVRGEFLNCEIINNTSHAASGAGLVLTHYGLSEEIPPTALTLTNCFIGDNKPLLMAATDGVGSAVRADRDDLLVLSGTTICGAGPDPVLGGTVDDDGTNCIAAYCGDANSDGTLDLCEADDGDGIFHVPSEYQRIQAAALLAQDGDTILVDPGIYTGVGPSVLDTLDKAVTVRSVVPHAAILDGEHERPVVWCSGGSVIDGFDIRGGGMLTLGSSAGGGVFAEATGEAPQIRNCHIHDCKSGRGGGIYSIGAKLEGTTIESCEALVAGGGVFTDGDFTGLIDVHVCGNTPDQIDGAWDDLGGNFIGDSCTPDCPDIDDDGQVGANEILLVISYWGSNDNDVDVTGNGVVDAKDLLFIIEHWGVCP